MNKRLSLLYFAIGIFFGVAAMASTKHVNSGEILFQNHMPSEALKTLLEAHSIQSDDIGEIVQATQVKWLRGKSRERWHMDKSTKPELHEAFEKLGMVNAITPSKIQYDDALILGASTNIMKQRMLYLVKLHQQGVQFKRAIFLVGDRPLSHENQNDETDKLPKHIQTEADVARHLVGALRIMLPKEIAIEVLSSPMKGQKRPTTQDTSYTYIKSKPNDHSSVLAISNQPFVGYQSAALNVHLKGHVDLEVVGEGIQEAAYSVNLDTLARWIYNYAILHRVIAEVA